MLGLLFVVDGPGTTTIRVHDGGTVELGGRIWCARMRPEGLKLAINTASDDSDIKYNERVADLRNELNQRKQELGALREQQLQLMAKMEQVWVLVVNM